MKPIDKSERYTLTQLVVQNLKQFILDRNMQPGDKLPAERELSLILGVSRAILREALRSLESFGILEIKHGEGSYVATNFVNPLFEQLSFIVQMNAKTVREIHEIRYLLEAAALAAHPTPTSAIWAELEQLADQYANPELSHTQRTALDAKLHLTLIRSLGNQTLVYLAEPLIQQVPMKELDLNGIEQSVQEHKRYLEAVRNGDMTLAAAILLEHLSDNSSTRSSNPRL